MSFVDNYDCYLRKQIRERVTRTLTSRTKRQINFWYLQNTTQQDTATQNTSTLTLPPNDESAQDLRNTQRQHHRVTSHQPTASRKRLTQNRTTPSTLPRGDSESEEDRHLSQRTYQVASQRPTASSNKRGSATPLLHKAECTKSDLLQAVPLPTPTAPTVQAWENRPEVLRLVTGADYQMTQRRFLGFADLAPNDRINQFNICAKTANWAPSTSSGYYVAIVTMMKTLGRQLADVDRAQLKVLSYAVKEVDGPRPTRAAIEEEILAAAQNLDEREAVALLVAWEVAQRPGDLLRLTVANVKRVDDPSTGLKLWGLTIRKGKATRRRQPFTVHCQRDTELGKRLGHLIAHPLLGGHVFTLQRIQTRKIIRQALVAENACLNMLSIRKGALQHLALKGTSVATLLSLSRHASLEMLERYLGWGALNLESARERYGRGQKRARKTSDSDSD